MKCENYTITTLRSRGLRKIFVCFPVSDHKRDFSEIVEQNFFLHMDEDLLQMVREQTRFYADSFFIISLVNLPKI